MFNIKTHKLKTENEIFEEYIKPSIKKFEMALNEYYEIKNFTENDENIFFKIYFHHNCKFSKYCILEIMNKFHNNHPENDYIEKMILDFSANFLKDNEAITIYFEGLYYLYVIKNGNITVLSSQNHSDVNKEIEKRNIIIAYEI